MDAVGNEVDTFLEFEARVANVDQIDDAFFGGHDLGTDVRDGSRAGCRGERGEHVQLSNDVVDGLHRLQVRSCDNISKIKLVRFIWNPESRNRRRE